MAHPFASMWTASLVVAGVTLPMWHALVKSASDNAALLTPIAFFVVALLKIWGEWPPAEKRAALVARLAPSAAKLKHWAFIAVALLSLGTVFLFVTKGSAKAAPASQALVSVPSGKRKRSDDDTGGDTTDSVPDADKPGAPKWFWKAKELIGIAEALPNGRANPKVKEMFAAVDGFDPATVDCRNVPWCSVFVNYVLQQCGIIGTRSAMARSFMRSRAFTKLDEPRVGCIVVMWRGKYDDGETGHVGFYAGEKGNKRIVVLGGNQNDQVEFEDQWKTKVKGYYWPRGKWESHTNRGAAVAAAAPAAGAGAIAYSELADDKAKIPGVPDGVSLEAAKQTAESIQQGLEATGHPKAMKIAMLIGFALLALGVAGAVYAIYRRGKDHNAGF